MKKTGFWNLPRTIVAILAAWVFVVVHSVHAAGL
jgi:hypothetical protein